LRFFIGQLGDALQSYSR